ncbi:MAG TPA: hypothetical protein VN812_23105 [Candidatus Acidoferrales bacterium]|nr:hypothetical protein [Candidatus Acidoferrales bacterium]
MRNLTQELKPIQQPKSTAVRSGGTLPRQSREGNSILHLQRTIGNQAVQRLLHANAEDLEVNSSTLATGHFAHDFSRIPVYHQAPADEEGKTSASLDGVQASGLRDLRARVSRVTGIDVGGVPVETGDARGKRAVTHEARVTLGSEATEHDVAHELAHAAQQRAFSGAWLGADALERRADEVATVAVSGGSAAVAAGRAPTAAILGTGDPYSREAITLTQPLAGATVKDFKDQLQLKIDSGDITGYSISGVKAGDPQEMFLYNALILLANKQRWGSELDLVTSIGAGKGEVTVRFDAAGKAEARLVGKSAPTVPAAFAKAKDASDAIVAKYKLAKVTGEHGRNWTIDDLNKVLAAWGRLSPAEAVALEGYVLIRTDKLSQNGESLQGQTTHTDELKQRATQATHLREIRFADSAFAADDKSFIGDAADAAPASFEILIHEVGHAFEAKPYDDVNAPAAVDAAKANQSAATAHAVQLAANKAINAALRGKFPKQDLASGQPLLNAVLSAQKVFQAFEESPDAANDALAKKAIADRDAVKTTIAMGNKVVIGLATALTEQDAYFAALEKLLAASAAAAASRAKADALKSGSNTKRLQAFIDFVTAEKIQPPTAYAAKHWPAEPAEFFDEAFSLWKNDPAFFAKYSSKLKAWFDAGNHLK